MSPAALGTIIVALVLFVLTMFFKASLRFVFRRIVGAFVAVFYRLFATRSGSKAEAFEKYRHGGAAAGLIAVRARIDPRYRPLDACRLAVGRDPHEPQNWKNLAEAFRLLGDEAQAVEALDMAVYAQNPRHGGDPDAIVARYLASKKQGPAVKIVSDPPALTQDRKVGPAMRTFGKRVG